MRYGTESRRQPEVTIGNGETGKKEIGNLTVGVHDTVK